MSEHWDPNHISGRRTRPITKVGPSRQPDRIRRGSAAFNGRELRMMIIVGLGLGLAMFVGSSTGFDLGLFASDTPTAKAEGRANADPYAEARRSRAILDQQAGDAAAAEIAARALRGTIVRPASVRLIGADTFAFHGDRIRLADIDAPQIDGACPYEIGLAGRAVRRLRALIAEGPFELGEAGGRDTDSAGRRLRIAMRDGRSFGGILVAEGLARPWTGQPQPWCARGLAYL